MIEVEHDQIVAATIDTARAPQRVMDILQIPRLKPVQVCGWRTIWIQPPPSSSLSGPTSVTVRAYDLALGDLLFERAAPGRFNAEEADGGAFIAEVIELEHDGVGLTTVRTRVRLEVVPDKRLPLEASPTLRKPDLLEMPVATLSEVGAEAISAPPLAALGVAIEGVRGKHALAATAATEGRRVRNGLGRRWGRLRSSGRRDVPYPSAHRGQGNAQAVGDHSNRETFPSQRPGCRPFGSFRFGHTNICSHRAQTEWGADPMVRDPAAADDARVSRHHVPGELP